MNRQAVKPEGENDAAAPSFLEVSLRLERRHVTLAEDLMLAQGAQALYRPATETICQWVIDRLAQRQASPASPSS